MRVGREAELNLPPASPRRDSRSPPFQHFEVATKATKGYSRLVPTPFFAWRLCRRPQLGRLQEVEVLPQGQPSNANHTSTGLPPFSFTSSRAAALSPAIPLRCPRFLTGILVSCVGILDSAQIHPPSGLT